MKLKLKIIDLEGVYLEKEVDLVNLFTSSGNLTILANHLPLITNIYISHMYYKNDNETTYFAISGGTLFVSETECKIITPAIEAANEIDFDRALAAKERATALLQSKNENIDYQRAEVALKRAINRLSFK